MLRAISRSGTWMSSRPSAATWTFRDAGSGPVVPVRGDAVSDLVLVFTWTSRALGRAWKSGANAQWQECVLSLRRYDPDQVQRVRRSPSQPANAGTPRMDRG